MVKRSPVSAPQNRWFNSQVVDDTDLSLEQTHDSVIDSSIINNHIGTGVLAESLVPNILFDSSLAVGFLDGVAVVPQAQPSDNNFGNQIEVELTNSNVAGKRNVKVSVIGLDFNGNLQFENFTFKLNEIQTGAKHFAKILIILFNDFVGDPQLSLNLGGKIVLREAHPAELSRDALMVAQDLEPNLFFRDFFINDTSKSLHAFLQDALPLYNVDTLNIFTSILDNKILAVNDVTTQIGQKFQASTNNIQKVSLLLSVRNQEVGHETDLVWNGDLVISIYPLQSSIECFTDIAPNLQIDFAPTNMPVAQLSFSYSTLSDAGIILNSIPQPIDFIFSNSPIASGNVLIPGNYYAVTIKRSGAANKCDILVAAGNDRVSNSRITTFTGTLWVDIPEQDLWFRIWTDAAKVSDGQAYDTGHGIIIPKTKFDDISQSTIDFSLNKLQFVGNDVFKAVLFADTQENTPISDQRTGTPVFSRRQFVPEVQLLNSLDISNLEKTTEPLLLGAISDRNRKFFDSISASINSKLYSATLANNSLIVKIVDDPTDTVRFDTSVGGLVTNLLNGDFINAKIFPDASDTSAFYRIASATLCSMVLGDVNGDGIIDAQDAELLDSYLGYDFNVGLLLNTAITTDGYTTTYSNGYTTLIKPFSIASGLSFQLVDPDTHTVVVSATDGVLQVDPNNPRLGEFASTAINFNTIVGVGGYKLVILDSSKPENHGGFDIIFLDSVTDVLTIRKILLNEESIQQMLRADIDGDFHVSSNDGYLLGLYLDRVASFTPIPPSMAPTSNAFNKIGTKFNVIKFELEEFTDRTDDYSSVVLGRATTIHPLPDIFESDGYMASHNFYSSPLSLLIQKQLTWDDSLISVNSRSKLVPSVFPTLSGFVENSCETSGTQCHLYPLIPDFDPGKVDSFVPNNLILGAGGELLRSDGSFYKVDFEVGTIVLEIPDGSVGTEQTTNLMDSFVADYTGDGVTRLGFPAMKFSDCSFVKIDALSKNQIRFSVSVQSFSPNTNGLTSDGYEGVIVDGSMGVYIDYATGLLTINFANLFQDEILRTKNTKIQVNVFLKKGGFNNYPLFVDSTKVGNILKLISTFSGSVNNHTASINLGSDVKGILPIIHGGTGLSTVGINGTVLMSNGSSVSYQPIGAAPGTYNDIAFNPPYGTSSVQGALDNIKGLLAPSGNILSTVEFQRILILSGAQSTANTVDTSVGITDFNKAVFHPAIKPSSTQIIIFKAALETTSGLTGHARLFNQTLGSYVTGADLTTTNSTATILTSAALTIPSGLNVYEVHIKLDGIPGPSDRVTCKMAAVEISYA